jgi:TrmH family RNA methyltransferase
VFLKQCPGDKVLRMKSIESAANTRIKNLKKILTGKNRDYWVIEGKRLFKEAVESGVEINEVYVTKGTWNKELARGLKNPEIITIPNSLMASLSTVETPPGILAVAYRKSISEPVLDHGFAAFLWSVRDPGNLGTIVRSAEATGCKFIACSPDCADAYLPKVVRASMGSIFRVPIVTVANPKDYLASLRNRGISVYGLVPRDGINLFAAQIGNPSMVLIGGEAFGFPDELPVDHKIQIPMSGKVESLNTGVATSIAFYRFMMAI